MRCIPHIINLTVNDYMNVFHAKIPKLRNFIAALRCRVTRRDAFEDICKECNFKVGKPTLNFEMRGSSTLEKVKQVVNQCRVLNAVINRIDAISDFLVV